MTDRPILYLSPGMFDKGGISRYGRYQVRALRELLPSTEVRCLSLLPPDANGFEEPFAVDFASCGPSPEGKAIYSLAAAILAVTNRPALVWSAHVHFGPLAFLLAKAARAPLVQNIYGLEVWTNLGKTRALSLQHSQLVVSDCYATEAYAKEELGVDHRRTAVLWDCVDTSRFSPGDGGRVLGRYGVPDAPDTFTVLSLGRIAQLDGDYKGFGRLIDAVARLGDVSVRLVIAGDGDGRPALEREVANRGLVDRVHFTGRVDEADLPALYRSCDAFSLVTSSGYGQGEGLPLTPLEASACGKPILVGNEDGSAEAVEHGVTGFVVPSRDVASLAQRLALLREDADLRRDIGAAARERAIRHFSYERFRDRLEGLLGPLGVGGGGSGHQARKC